MYFDFPDRPERRTIIGDGTPYSMVVGCPNHGAHIGGVAFDLNYFTLEGNNATQYLPHGWERTEIWEDRNDPHSRLLLDVFDWERTWAFVKAIREITYSASPISMDHKIVTYIRACVPQKEKRLVDRLLFPSTHWGYNHHTHMHVFAHEILWDGRIK